ncbi:hypothetical protein T4B_14756 [Trichinella pseudospiralis]|uniref:Uncharacterized protein n=1 Tax=Trichinella pseudospiralis TaxID=6337 RepID=A0A0V1JCB2_TRIPS|nr:hypothetical protein T4B_14756 [Trichinella pseudospiralis]
MKHSKMKRRHSENNDKKEDVVKFEVNYHENQSDQVVLPTNKTMTHTALFDFTLVRSQAYSFKERHASAIHFNFGY